MIIYGIEEAHGDYEDYYTYIKKAFKSKEEAEAYKLKYDRILLKLQEFYGEIYAGWSTMQELENDKFFNKYYRYEDKHPCRIREIELI